MQIANRLFPVAACEVAMWFTAKGITNYQPMNTGGKGVFDFGRGNVFRLFIPHPYRVALIRNEFLLCRGYGTNNGYAGDHRVCSS